MSYLVTASGWWILIPGLIGAVLTWFLAVRRVTISSYDEAPTTDLTGEPPDRVE